MAEFFKKAVMAGVGLITQGSENMKKMVDDLVKKGEISRKEGEKLLKDLLKKGEKARKELSKSLHKRAETVLGSADIATKDDIDKLNKKIAALDKKITGKAKTK